MSRDSSRTHIHLHQSHHADLFEHFTNPLLNTGMPISQAGGPASQNLSSAAVQPVGPTGASYTFLSSTAASSSASSALAAVAHQSLLSSATTLASGAANLPHDDVLVPAHLEPPNPEDEDDVVPDQHAAFGITRAMAGREGRERAWRDFDSLRALVRGDELAEGRRGTDGASVTRTTLPR